MQERVVKVTPQQFKTVREALRSRDVVFGSLDYAGVANALRSIGIEPVDDTTYRFEVIPD